MVILKNAHWEEACRYSKEVAVRVEVRLIQLKPKTFHWTYFTRTRLLKMDRMVTDICLRGCNIAGTLLYTIWLCPLSKDI